ncbi:signal peptidase I [uncultured Dubosiella sp.]|uniref:signal peptidase I n=1 Tax=uncultured Dubosiella sp. TaxID=1937011 RepID=UPI0027309051|nr:signal peptidase I [uncultured Dubosiella sp.]
MKQKGNQNKERTVPPLELLEKERDRLRHHKNYRSTLRSMVGVLIVVSAIAILVATLWLPVLLIYGTSMTPTLKAGDIVLTSKGSSFNTGDVVAFYYNNKILVKRVIAGPGDWVYIDDDGNVFVNGEELNEPYVKEKALGETDLEYPYQVPEKRWFVMGDHRSVSLDSRTRAIGPVAEEMIVGKLNMKVWPLNEMGGI